MAMAAAALGGCGDGPVQEPAPEEKQSDTMAEEQTVDLMCRWIHVHPFSACNTSVIDVNYDSCVARGRNQVRIGQFRSFALNLIEASVSARCEEQAECDQDRWALIQCEWKQP